MESNDLSQEQKEILDMINKDFETPKRIALLRRTSFQAVYKTIKKLKEKGLIKTDRFKKGVEKLSLGMRVEKPHTNLHALQINFPIIKGKVKDNEWEIKNKLNHWLPKYKKFSLFGGLTIRNNNNKSISVMAHSRDIEDKSLNEIDNLAFKIRLYIIDFFKRQDVFFDWDRIETKNLNIATQDKKAESMIRKGEKFELDLQKKAEKIFVPDNIDAKAWLDGSPFKFTAETNDKEWKREYLNMPFSIKDIRNNMYLFQKSMDVLNAYQEQISLHLAVEKRTMETLINIDKTLSEFLKK